MSAMFFATELDFRNWLEQNHTTETALLVGFYKVGSKKPSMSWSQSVDQAICFGWIDGVRKTINDESYSIRFTPRKPSSIWSTVNIKKVASLTEQGLMTTAGLIAFGHRKENKSGIYSHENPDMALHKEYEIIFSKNKSAWQFFKKQSPSYQKRLVHWVMSAKQTSTQHSRLNKLIEWSEQGIQKTY